MPNSTRQRYGESPQLRKISDYSRLRPSLYSCTMPALPTSTWLLLALAAFLCGSIPFGLLIAKTKGIDIRKHGSGNIGATNVGRVLGKPYFFLCFSLDFLKGFLPTLAAGWYAGALGTLAPPPSLSLPWLAVMLATVLGHVFCPWLGFKGGKGVATALGAILAIFPALTVPGLAAFVVFILALKIKGYMSLASMAAGVSLPPLILAFFVLTPALGYQRPPFLTALPFLAIALLLAALVVYTHRANIQRLRTGTEPKFGKAKSS